MGVRSLSLSCRAPTANLAYETQAFELICSYIRVAGRNKHSGKAESGSISAERNRDELNSMVILHCHHCYDNFPTNRLIEVAFIIFLIAFLLLEKKRRNCKAAVLGSSPCYEALCQDQGRSYSSQEAPGAKITRQAGSHDERAVSINRYARHEHKNISKRQN